MATYKVIQDIEAEDKFLGPLTLKQFIFGAIAAIFIYLSGIAVSKHVAWLLIFFLPPALIGIFLTVPWSKDQPTEVWALAKLRFYFKPKKRLWDQSGVVELVTITVPKKIERQLTNNLSQSEVSSRLKALAETIDSRGWAIKHSSLASAAVDMNFNNLSDRLISPSTLPQVVPDFDDSQVRDMMDPVNNPVADNFDQMMQANSELRRDQSLEKMERIRRGEPLESIKLPEIHFTPPTFTPSELPELFPASGPIVPPPILPTTLDEKELSSKLRAQSHAGDEAYENLHTVPSFRTFGPREAMPMSEGTREAKSDPSQSASTMTTPSSPAIIDLAQNDDLSVETIARQAKKSREQTDSDEVVISLH